MINTFLSIYGVFSGFLFILAAYIFFKVTPDLVKKSEFYTFRTFILAFMLYLIMNFLWTLQEFEIVNIPRGLFTLVIFLSYTSVVFNAFCFYFFTLSHFNFNLNSRRSIILGLLPMVAAVILLLVSLKTGIIFSITKDAHLVTGPAYLALMGCAFIYFIVILCVSILRIIKSKNRYARREALILAGCVIFLTAWALLDNLFENFTIIPIAIYSVINFIFIHLLSSQIYTDALTNMNNRRKSEEFLVTQIENVSEEDPVYFYIADINSFKLINDTYGHVEGDQVLILVAAAIKKTVSQYGGFAARYGGDEFIWTRAHEKGIPADPEDIIRDIQKCIDELCVAQNKPYTISLCTGYICCDDPKKSVAAYLKEADDMLYIDKRTFHEKHDKK